MQLVSRVGPALVSGQPTRDISLKNTDSPFSSYTTAVAYQIVVEFGPTIPLHAGIFV